MSSHTPNNMSRGSAGSGERRGRSLPAAGRCWPVHEPAPVGAAAAGRWKRGERCRRTAAPLPRHAATAPRLLQPPHPALPPLVLTLQQPQTAAAPPLVAAAGDTGSMCSRGRGWKDTQGSRRKAKRYPSNGQLKKHMDKGGENQLQEKRGQHPYQRQAQLSGSPERKRAKGKGKEGKCH